MPTAIALTIAHRCLTDSGGEIPVGTIVEYLGHVLGGMVRVRWEGRNVIIHPGATKELGR